MEKLTRDEVVNYITSQYEYLNLTPEESERYVKFILKINEFRRWNVKLKNVCNSLDFFEERFNQLYDLFLQEGYDQDTSLRLTKNAVLYSDRKDYITNIQFLRMLNFEEKILGDNAALYKRSTDKIHAKKCFLLDQNLKDEQSINNIIKISDQNFEKKFSTNIAQLVKKYPITDETKNIWLYFGQLTDEKLFEEFKLTREELANIYPTTKEELITLKKIANLTEKEAKERYGLSKTDILAKRPLNSDTLKALRTLNFNSNEKIEKIFHKSKEEVLNLRTITTEMIILANTKFKLQRGTYSKEELLEKIRSMKK